MILTVTAVLVFQRMNVQQLEVIKRTVTIPGGDMRYYWQSITKDNYFLKSQESCVYTARQLTERFIRYHHIVRRR